MNTTPARGIEADDVRAALVTRDVLEFYGWRFKRSGSEFESTACPAKADHSRRAFVINIASGRWRCFPCATAGDLFDFIAVVERLSIRNDFATVLAKAAEIAGVGPSTLSPEERARKRAEWQQRQREAERLEREERRKRDQAAVPYATGYWSKLERAHARGCEYLRERGIDPALVVPDVVRFDPKHDGSPSVALHSFAGEIHNVVVRRVPELGEPKTRGLYQCPTAGTLIMSLRDIRLGSDVVLIEGVFDAITARLAWPEAVVLGGHGGENLAAIAQRAAPVVAKARGRFSVVPHQDEPGFKAAVAACDEALKAGLSVRRGTLRVVKHPHKDLNDAWRSGWRPGA